MRHVSRNLHAIGWMALAGLLIVSIYTVVRLLSADFHPFQLVFFYNALGLLVYLPFAWRRSFSVRTERMGLYALRATLEFAAFSVSFYALTFLPLPAHTALGFTSPLLGSLAAVLLLREPNCKHRWLALIVGFAGVLIVARPGFTDFGARGLIMLGSSACFALCMVIIKRLTQTEPSARIAFYMLGLTALIALPFALNVWRAPEMRHLPYILLLGALVAAVQYAVSQAFARADVTVVAPVFFLNLIWSSLVAYLVFEEVVDVWTILGGALIIKATAYAAHRARKAMPVTLAASAAALLPTHDAPVSLASQ